MSTDDSIDPDLKIDPERAKQFGGPAGVVAIMVASHLIPYYLWISWRFYDGALTHPRSLGDIIPYLLRMAEHVRSDAAPTLDSAVIYFGFLALQVVLAVTLPGIKMRGLPIRSLGGRQLEYVCNGTWAWYVTLALGAALHFTGVFPLSLVGERFGRLLTWAIVTGDAVALFVFVGALATGNATRLSGRLVHDFFMGAWLNPRIGRFDLKMWAEIRVAWMFLFFLTASAAATQYATHGRLSVPMIFMLLAHGLYTNACMKGEECIPTTWDIFHEKCGWMLMYWNFAGVPFVYCFSSWYLATHVPFEHSLPYTVVCFVLLVCAYYVWDTAQSQRNRFRMQTRGTYVRRRAFPQLPWGTLRNPEYMETASGSRLLVDGWWRYARKIHYSADVIMAATWGLICGFDHYLPYFYVTFFVLMIAHRATRDVRRCRAKYGEDWERYTKKVPWMFIPGVF